MLPESAAPFDVLVVGAGPAGSACAQLLAQAGQRVALVDKHAFPRDKVCGDGLIPDALAAFKHLGVFEEVMAAAQAASHVACIAPRGGRVDVPGDVAVLPRRVLDDILYRAALRAGAVALPQARFVALLREGGAPDGRVVGVQLKRGDALVEQRARWVVLATGASATALIAAGVAAEVREHFGDQVLKTSIPRSVRVSEAPSYGQTVMTYDPGSTGALSYLEAARELARQVEQPLTTDPAPEAPLSR